MNDEHSLRRMAGDYEIIQAIHIGDREIVLGEKPQSESGDKYMCAFCQQNELFAAYSEVMCTTTMRRWQRCSVSALPSRPRKPVWR